MTRRLVLSLSILVAALGMAAPAQAETITGTFRYLDRDSRPSFLPDGTPTTTITRTPRPIVAAKVEIYARPPGANWGSSPVATARTDDSGAISVPVTQLPGTTYALRVYAFNDAAAVWQKVVLPTGPFWEEPGRPEGAAIRLPAPSPTGTVDFSWDFNDFWTAAHYNVADTIRLGRQYALARRHPVESASNPIPEVSVQPSSGWAGVSHYNFTIDQLLIKDNDMFDDVTLLHEYAHFLEEKISKFAPIASNHDGCKATMVGDATATPINSPEHAWMEGFADYFAAAVISSLPGGRTDVFGIATAAGLEAPPGIFSVPSCTLVRSTFPADTIELDVAAVLWDLVDGGFNESADTVSGRDEEIFRIFDQELSTPSDPTIEDFRAAWVARGLPAAALGRIYTLNGLTFRRNLAPIADAGPDRHIPERFLSVLDGSLSEDPETATLSVTWTQTGGPPVTLSSRSVLTPTFMAPSVGSAGATLTFRLDVSEGPGGLSATDFVQLIVRDVPGYGELAPSSLDFGVRRAGVKVTKTVTLTNTGSGWLELGAKQVTGSTAFTLESSTCPQLLRVNESCTLTVAFVPPASGMVNGLLTVATQNSPNATVQVPLRGEGGTPSAELDAGSLAFGQVNVGAAWSERIQLSNTGTVPVTISSIQSWGQGFSHAGCPATIPVDGACVVTVTFRPTAAGYAGGGLSIDDDGGGPRWIPLSGTGVAVGVASVTPGALSFGSLGVGNTSGSATVALTNYGGAPLYVWDVRVSGHYADFRIVSDPCRGATLQPFGSCVVQVAFTPQATGTRSGTLEFATNGIQRTTLTGIGVGKPAQTAWAQLGFGPARGGFNAEEVGIDTASAASLALQWELPLGADVSASPAVVDGVAYVATLRGTVHAVDLASGKELWVAMTRGPVRSSPAVVDGVVYVGSDDGSVYAFDAARGANVWTFATKGPVEASPAVEGPVVLAGSLDGSVYALDAATGTELWSDPVGPVSVSPALAGGVAYAVGGNQIRAYDLKSGGELWREHVNGLVRTPLVVADGLVLAGTEAGRLNALSATSGASQWTFDTPGPAVTSLAAAYGIVFAGDEGGDLTAIDTTSGDPIWTLSSGRAWLGLAAANGLLYGTTDDGDLHAVDAWTGADLGAVGAKAFSPPVVANGAVYVGTSSGLAAIAP